MTSRAVATLLMSVALLACSSDQDPGVTPSTQPGPSTTSYVLQPCPEGGPDATTPPAGCLDPEGSVVRP